MKVLIVGGSSALGIQLRASIARFAEVITAGRTNCNIRLDLRNVAEAVVFPKDIDVVIHTAASFGGTTSEEIMETELVNVMGTLRVCQLSAEAGVKHLIFISSMSALLTPGSPYYSAYALSKRQAEEISYFVCVNQKLRLTILRPSQLYGISEDFKRHQPLIYNIIDQAQRGEDITLFGNNDALRNYLHVDDFIKVILNVMDKKIAGLYNCQYTDDVVLSDVAKAAISAFGSKSKIKFLKEMEDIDDNVFPLDNTLYKEVGYYPGFGIKEGMTMIANSRLRK